MELIGPCIEAEAAVSGRHADNVAPGIVGRIGTDSQHGTTGFNLIAVARWIDRGTDTPTGVAHQRSPGRTAKRSSTCDNGVFHRPSRRAGERLLFRRSQLVVTEFGKTKSSPQHALGSLLAAKKPSMRPFLVSGALGASISGATEPFRPCRSQRSAVANSPIHATCNPSCRRRCNCPYKPCNCPAYGE